LESGQASMFLLVLEETQIFQYYMNRYTSVENKNGYAGV
jgi:hypothetical protein